ncbi:serine kinase [Ancylobacter sp.]|uniref:serine kinase n=1 Tax=Ancylobacter sp. TaxID=1872567 RepID=UPI003D0AF5CD
MTFTQAPKGVASENLAGYARHLLDAAFKTETTRLERRRFRLPRLGLDVWFASAALRRLCEGALVEAPHSQAVAEAEIYALHAMQGQWPSPLYWRDTADMSPRHLDRALSEDGLRGSYHDLPSWQIYDPATRRGVQSLASPLAFPPWESTSPLRLFLHWAYAAAGLRLTHAATLGRNGAGVLLAGAGGSGKSGTTLAGILHGLDSAGDDYVVVEPGPTVIAHAIFRNFKQDPGGLERAGLARMGRERPLNWQGKIEFNPADLGRPLSAQMDIRAILLPHVARAGRTTLTPASAQQAALALAPSAVLQFSGDSQQGFRFFADLARRLPAFHLNLSEDPVEITSVLSAFFDRGFAHAG